MKNIYEFTNYIKESIQNSEKIVLYEKRYIVDTIVFTKEAFALRIASLNEYRTFYYNRLEDSEKLDSFKKRIQVLTV